MFVLEILKKKKESSENEKKSIENDQSNSYCSFLELTKHEFRIFISIIVFLLYIDRVTDISINWASHNSHGMANGISCENCIQTYTELCPT